jgi:hypothetical protein
MDEYNTDKKYEAFKIPTRRQVQEGRAAKALPQTKNGTQFSLFDGLFYEIEYDSSPIEGVGKFVLKSQKIEPPEKDEIRELFYSMRDIARQYRSPFTNDSRFYDKRVQQENAKIFFKQAVFMKDFEDDYPEQVPFSSYFPYYQMLGYKQLRTYFTWRTQVRKGIVAKTSLSYVFLYIYELLNHVGADSPQDDLDRLVSFWTSFKEHDTSVDKYVLRWLKDYHIYYDLPQTFKDFVEEHHLTEYYPKIADPGDSFDLFCAISKYDVRKSVFFTDETSKLITDCFHFVIEKIRQDFEAAGIHFDDALFRPTKKMTTWKPFKDALFYQRLKQPDRRVVMSENEIYICSKNEWTFSPVITTEKGRQFIGYVMKQMESVLRSVTKYKFKITANIDMVHQETLGKLKKSGLLIENIVQAAVMEFYREATRTVVTVDHASLARIRQEALATQESLIVEEQAEPMDAPVPIALPLPDQSIFADPSDPEPAPVSDNWKSLRDALSESELQALAIILQGGNIKKFADNNNIMLEVLADGINEKATDYIGDNILDDEPAIYEDYEEQVKGMVEA